MRALMWFLVLIPVGVSLACSCAFPGTPSEELAKYDAVFLGRVVNIAWVPYGYAVDFEVQKSWKGVAEKHVQVATGLGGGDCGYLFEHGKSYVVYASGENLYTGICSRTNEVSHAQEDLELLGQGKEVAGESVVGTGSEFPGMLVAMCIVGVLFVFLGAVIFVLTQGR